MQLKIIFSSLSVSCDFVTKFFPVVYEQKHVCNHLFIHFKEKGVLSPFSFLCWNKDIMVKARVAILNEKMRYLGQGWENNKLEGNLAPYQLRFLHEKQNTYMLFKSLSIYFKIC